MTIWIKFTKKRLKIPFFLKKLKIISKKRRIFKILVVYYISSSHEMLRNTCILSIFRVFLKMKGGVNSEQRRIN